MPDLVSNEDKWKEGWHGGLPETPCGYGSKLSATRKQREWIAAVVKRHEIKTVTDIGAGDLNWVRAVNWDVEYKAYDIYPRHSSVVKLDITKESPEPADMVMCLWVLNHLDPDAQIASLMNIVSSGSKYLMLTKRKHEQWDITGALEEIVLNKKEDRIILYQNTV